MTTKQTRFAQPKFFGEFLYFRSQLPFACKDEDCLWNLLFDALCRPQQHRMIFDSVFEVRHHRDYGPALNSGEVQPLKCFTRLAVLIKTREVDAVVDEFDFVAAHSKSYQVFFHCRCVSHYCMRQTKGVSFDSRLRRSAYAGGFTFRCNPSRNAGECRSGNCEDV